MSLDLNLTLQQKATLEQFRNVVADVLQPQHDDVFLLRWLRARNYDVRKAESMMRESLAWRAKNGMDEVLDTWKPPEVLEKYYPKGFLGYDKEGRPVWILCYGRCDIKGLLESATVEDCTKYVLYIWEKSKVEMAQQTKRLGKPVTQHTIIFDLEGFGLRHALWKPAIEFMLTLAQRHEANYPEVLHRVFVVNAPSIFSLAWALIKPFLHENTAQKILIFTSDRSKWVPVVLETVDAATVPQNWGGIRTDPDGNPYCASIVSLGGPVPKSYYRSYKGAAANTTAEEQTECPLKNSALIYKGDALRLEYDVQLPRSRLRWIFQTDGFDIGFSVCRIEPNGNEDEVVPYVRVESHVAMEEGELTCPKEGKYVVIFDNSYSMVRSKSLFYEVELLPPEEKSTEVYSECDDDSDNIIEISRM